MTARQVRQGIVRPRSHSAESSVISGYGPNSIAEAREKDRAIVVIDVILKIVEEENAAIRATGVKEVEKFAERKGQALMNLSSLMATESARVLHPSVLEKLHVLRAAIQSNLSLLKIHIDAVTEVSQIIVRCVQSSHSDGTYSRPLAPYGQV